MIAALKGSARSLRNAVYRLPGVRHLRCVGFRRLAPLRGGRPRGTPIVRYYWDDFLTRHRESVRGVALEVGTTETLRRVGGSAVARADAMDLADHVEDVRVVADLSRADHVPADGYDCFVVPFSTHVIYDVEAALYHAVRLLKPGGVLLASFSCVEYYFPRGLDMGTGGAMHVFWSFTPVGVDNLLRRCGLGDGDYRLDVYGNLFARIAYQMNVPAEELTRRELTHHDLGHPLLICAKIVKPADWRCERPAYREAWTPPGPAAKWTPERGHYAT